MRYYVGDKPVDPLVIEPALDLDDFTAATAEATAPDGDTTALTATLDAGEGTVSVAWPATSLFDEAGLYGIRITLTAAGGQQQRIPVVQVVAQDDSDGWNSLDTARDLWADAPRSDLALYEVLEVAKNEILNFAPELSEDAPIPNSYRRAQLMNARDVWNASKVDAGSGELGEETFAIRPFPLDWSIKQILRPRRGAPTVA